MAKHAEDESDFHYAQQSVVG